MSLKLRSINVAILALISANLAMAEPVSKAPAFAIAATDTQVEWGPCPSFMPEGCGLAVLHGDPASPNADVFLKVPAGQMIPHHWHTSAERMVLISGELEVAYDGQQPATLTAGMYAYGPAKLAHTAICAKYEPCILFIAFEGPVDAVPTADSKE